MSKVGVYVSQGNIGRVCCHCGHTRAEKEYYKTFSQLYYGGYMPLCKDCFRKLYNQYQADYHSSKKAMQRLCMAFDIYWNETVFDQCDKNDGTVIGRYIRSMNLGQHAGKTFDDTIEEGFDFSGDRKPVRETRVAVVDEYDNVVDSLKGVPQSVLDKWGTGFDAIDYNILDSHYKSLKHANPNLNQNQEIFVDELCYTHMQSMKAMRAGDIETYSKLRKSYRESFKQAGLNPETDKSSQAGMSISELLLMISQHTPEEYYKDKARYQDWDGIGDYYKRMVVRPEQNIEYGTADRDPEYCVPDDTFEIEDEDEDYGETQEIPT